MQELTAALVFWGVWLLAPLLVDGLTTLGSLVTVLAALASRRKAPPLRYAPMVTIILPIYNSADTLEACLRSITAQDYPMDRIELLLVDNGSRDSSFSIYQRMQPQLPPATGWLAIPANGKAWAMNAGIHLAHGRYLFNVDSDAALAPDAVRRIVEAMEASPRLVAVTGAISVLPPEPDAPPLLQALTACEWLEYLTAFQVGRRFQSVIDDLYTLSGAFSVFRRDVLVQTSLYTQRTTTEDTDLTFELHSLGLGSVGCVAEAIAYVHPIPSLRSLYAQRVRWQRGQVEVSARHQRLMRRWNWHLRGFNPARTLLVDHTLAFPRIAWTALLPLLTAFGYPASLLVQALLALYFLYLLIDAVWVGTALIDATPETRASFLARWWALPLLPLYRMLVFWFRISGFLHAVAEPGQWRVQDPVTQLAAALRDTRDRAARLARRLLSRGEAGQDQP